MPEFQNVKVTISKDKKKATIEVDLTKRMGASTSGKTIKVASTGGNKQLEGTDVFLGVNAYVYPEPKE